jgi:hypothetical protein
MSVRTRAAAPSGALVAAKFAFHRTRCIDPAQFFDLVVGDSVLENVAPRIVEASEYRWGAWTDSGVLNFRWIDVTGERFAHVFSPPSTPMSIVSLTAS